MELRPVQNKAILLVEDNPDDETLALRALKKNNILNEVVIARDGAEALDYLFPGSPDSNTLPQLVLLDLKLPKVDGFEILKRIRSDARTRHLPVVILTSSREEQDLINGYSAHANSYICKPIDFAQFTEAVRQIGMYWLVLNETAPAGVF